MEKNDDSKYFFPIFQLPHQNSQRSKYHRRITYLLPCHSELFKEEDRKERNPNFSSPTAKTGYYKTDDIKLGKQLIIFSSRFSVCPIGCWTRKKRGETTRKEQLETKLSSQTKSQFLTGFTISVWEQLTVLSLWNVLIGVLEQWIHWRSQHQKALSASHHILFSSYQMDPSRISKEK